ncbi:phosphate acetyltransferase [Nicoliella spurrieriana]|uniref:Phosphate acetyltransferase n=1 Tax=Nicoliella spurrieriana TaxID=2925830 RepID=A0A976RSA4_9LACO|nr:phosphate acetyltransferase [Nicoliella spurrieriana]UQS86960.1 phosphate acetyltransferase [Nicoliella spurrieriana]
MDLFESLKQKVSQHKKTIVFPEGSDIRIVEATSRLATDGVVQPILLGNPTEIKQVAAEAGIELNNVTIFDYQNLAEDEAAEYVTALVERRNGKTDEATAKQWLADPNYFATMMVYLDKADGMVSGAAHPTGDTVRPALQIIKTKPGIKLVSGCFIMMKGDQRYVFADCAINLELDADGMADVAIESAATAKQFGIDPKVAMLSFSTKGSARGPMVKKVQSATALVHEKQPDLAVDGELQFDAAFVPAVGQKKAPDSKVAGKANVFVFPELQSGNIGYKIAQRLGGFEALGPILQGLNKPVSDLSRGCNAEDVYKVAIINALQAME